MHGVTVNQIDRIERSTYLLRCAGDFGNADAHGLRGSVAVPKFVETSVVLKARREKVPGGSKILAADCVIKSGYDACRRLGRYRSSTDWRSTILAAAVVAADDREDNDDDNAADD